MRLPNWLTKLWSVLIAMRLLLIFVNLSKAFVTVYSLLFGNCFKLIISICITGFKLKLGELVEDIAIYKNRLRNFCDGERLTFLQNRPKQFKDKFYKDLEKKKHKKINKLSPSLLEIPNMQNHWILDLNLTNQDRLNIRYNEKINDFIILQAMNL